MLLSNCKENQTTDICEDKANEKRLYALINPENCIKCNLYLRGVIIKQYASDHEFCYIFNQTRKKEAEKFILDNLGSHEFKVIVSEPLYAKYDSLIPNDLNYPAKVFKLTQNCNPQLVK